MLLLLKERQVHKKFRKLCCKKNNINFLHTICKEEKNIPPCQFKGILSSLSAERMTVLSFSTTLLLHYLTFLPQTAAKKCIFFHRKAYSFKDDECEGENQSRAYSKCKKCRKWWKSFNSYQLVKLGDGKQKEVSLYPNLSHGNKKYREMASAFFFIFPLPTAFPAAKSFHTSLPEKLKGNTCPRLITLTCQHTLQFLLLCCIS